MELLLKYFPKSFVSESHDSIFVYLLDSRYSLRIYKDDYIGYLYDCTGRYYFAGESLEELLKEAYKIYISLA